MEGYADNSRGVSLGLDLTGIRPPSAVGTAVTFAPCVYKPVDKSELLKAVFAHYKKGLQAWWDSFMVNALKEQMKVGVPDPQLTQRLLSDNSQQLHEVVVRYNADLQYDLLRIAPLLKDESFFEEKEWRLVLPWENIKLPTNYPLQFRPIRDALVPYIAYPLNQPNQDGPIFCKGLILGSGSHSSAEVGVNLFFENQGIRVFARASKIPYRPT